MSNHDHDAAAEHDLQHGDSAPGDENVDQNEIAQGVKGYLIGFALAVGLSIVSFYMARSTLVWAPSIPIALSVLAMAQMGVHLVFFLHITTGQDNVNNVLALAFGALIVFLVIGGSIWIMHAMNANMMNGMAM
jgi:cytochrome o ubiquinol oxidase subunit IV